MATVISREIGSTGYYSTPQAWEDDRPADMVAADEQWEGLLQNQNFTGSGPIITISGSTTSATCYAHLTTAPGASFLDHASFATNPLRADSTKGAMIQKTGGYGDDAVVISEPYAKISKIQVIADYASGLGSRAAIKTVDQTAEIDSVIAESYRANYGYGTINSLGGIIRNSLIIMRQGGADAVVRCANGTPLQIYNSTIVVPSDVTAAGQGVRKNYGSVTLKNVSVFGCTNDVGGSGGSFSISNCATDDASPTTGFTGSLVYADQFEAVADATRDFRLKAGSDLFDLGVTDATNAPTDMVGTTRPVGASDIGPIETVTGGDTTPPTLTSPTGTQTGSTTASGTVSTDENNATLFAVVTTSATSPSVAQVQAGQDHTGASAAFAVGSGSGQAVTTTGVQNVSATGLTASTAYYWHYQQQDTATNDSTVVTSAQFTTAAPADTTAPVLTSPAGASTGETTISGSVSTDEDNATLYAVVSTSTTKPSVAQIQAGQDHTGSAAIYGTNQAVSATGTQNVAATGLTASTGYYWHFQQIDTAGNDSTVVTSALITTDAVAVGTLTTEALKNNTGTVIANDTGLTVDVYSISTGALVIRFTGETTDASGICVVSDAAITAATAYTVVVRRSTNAIGVAEITAT